MAPAHARDGGVAGDASPESRRVPRFSIVVPQFDCRDAGCRALESALAQDCRRDLYEVIAIVDSRAQGAWPAVLLGGCERVVAVDADFGDVESEIGLFEAGSRAARGEFLYFIEGHTVLAVDALRRIDEYLGRDPDCAIACGRRINHARTRLGRLIAGNNDAHELRARSRGDFALGANCVIRRALFDAIGGLDRRFFRYSETVLYQRALAAGVHVGKIDAELCTHHNDAPFRWLVRLLVATGCAKARYYGAARTRGAVAPAIRHPVYRWLASPMAAALAAAPLRIAGPAMIATAMALVGRFPTFAQRLYLMGVAGTDVAGFCIERGLPRALRRMISGAPPQAASVRIV